MLYSAAHALNSEALLLKNNELMSMLSFAGVDLQGEGQLPDYVVFTDKDIYLAKQLEYMGIPVFNSAYTIAASDDKIVTYQELARRKLPMPETVIAPKIFTEGRYSEKWLDRVISQLGLPLILKEAFGSFGEQVYLIHTKEELFTSVKQVGNKAFVFQEFIETSFGVDIRLQVVGDQVVAAMKRRSLNDFRANVTAGGTMEAYTPSETEKELAIQATKAIQGDFAGVDLLFGAEGPLICEVNSNAHIRNLLDSTGINAADFIMEHILTNVKQKSGFES